MNLENVFSPKALEPNRVLFLIATLSDWFKQKSSNELEKYYAKCLKLGHKAVYFVAGRSLGVSSGLHMLEDNIACIEVQLQAASSKTSEHL